MDAYTDLLRCLSQDDYPRLRQFREDAGAQFTTWLVVVSRRLCVDFLRQRYGRTPTVSSKGPEHAMRRRLEDLLAVEIGDRTDLPEPRPGPEETLRQRDLHRALAAALAQLPPAHRLLLSLRFEDDLPVREIATLLHYPTRFHVHRTLNAVLADLRRRLVAGGVDGATP